MISHASSKSSAKKSRGGKSDEEWPLKVKSGSVIVKIYRYERKGSRQGTFLYTISNYLSGKLERIKFTDLAKATLEAQKIANKIANQEAEVLQVDRADWRLYSLAKEALRETGVPIDVACREYAEAFKIIGSQSLTAVVRQYAADMKREALVPIKVPELVEQFIQSKINTGVGKRGIEDYRNRLQKFAKSFHCPVAAIGTDQLQAFLDKLKVSGRTKKNFKAIIVTLFRYARSKKYLPRDRSTEAEHLDPIIAPPTDIGIFSPRDFAKLISNAPQELVAYLAIRAFAGIRDSELNRMEWSNVKFEEGQIEVPASAAKRTRAKGKVLRRLVPIQPNLAKWLAPYRGSIGKICTYALSEWESVKLAKKLKIKWVRNGLRHGFGSYRVAQTKNYPLVAYEMGNSVDVIKSCYDQVVNEKEAAKWFSIEPENSEKIIHIPVEQTA